MSVKGQIHQLMGQLVGADLIFHATNHGPDLLRSEFGGCIGKLPAQQTQYKGAQLYHNN